MTRSPGSMQTFSHSRPLFASHCMPLGEKPYHSLVLWGWEEYMWLVGGGGGGGGVITGEDMRRRGNKKKELTKQEPYPLLPPQTSDETPHSPNDPLYTQSTHHHPFHSPTNSPTLANIETLAAQDPDLDVATESWVVNLFCPEIQNSPRQRRRSNLPFRTLFQTSARLPVRSGSTM